MFNTIDTKIEQLRTGFTRSGFGPKTVLLVGSCRSVPYFNYLTDVNRDGALSIYFIDPFYWNWDAQERRVNFEDSLRSLEQHAGLRSLFAAAEWFVHEHYENFGFFNTDRACAKQIYQFGLNPAQDLCIPNFNNLFVLFQDLVNFHHELRPRAHGDLTNDGRLSPEVQHAIAKRGQEDIAKFLEICRLSSFPEFGDRFRDNWTKTRYWWTCNHVTSAFTVSVFELVAQRLGLVVTPELRAKWLAQDPYASHFTPVTQYDRDNYGVSWPEATVPLSTPPL